MTDTRSTDTGQKKTSLIGTRHGRIAVCDTGGDGFPILLLHGSGASHRVFEDQMQPPLTEKARLIALDLPGHGASDDAADPKSAYSLTGLAEAVEDVAAALRLSRFAVFGWSLGGHVAIELLARNRTVDGLLLAGTPPVSPGLIGMLRGFSASFDLFLGSKPHWLPRDIDRFEKLCYDHAGTPELRAAMERADGRLRPVFSQSMMRGEGHDQRRTIADADVPVFLVNGANDPFVRLSYAAGFEDGARGHHAAVIDGAGHAAFRERPAAFNAHFERFIDAAVIHAARATPKSAATGR